MPDPSAVHLTAPLANIAIAFPTTGFIAPRLLADIPVNKQTDSYFIFDAARRREAQSDDARNAGAEAREVKYDVTTSTYRCEGHALKIDVTDEEVANSDPPLSSYADATEFVVDNILLNQEIDCKAKLDASLTGAQTSDPTHEWNDPTNGDPFADIELAINTIEDVTGFTPNVMGMDSKVWRALRKHPDILERVVYGGGPTTPAQVNTQAVAALFDIDEIVVTKALSNTVVKGQTASLSRVWGDDVYIAYRPTRAALKVPALGYRMVWSQLSGGAGGFKVGSYRHPLADTRKQVITVEKYYDQKITLATAGYRLQNRLT
jgi:hypothetical protein